MLLEQPEITGKEPVQFLLRATERRTFAAVVRIGEKHGKEPSARSQSGP